MQQISHGGPALSFTVSGVETAYDLALPIPCKMTVHNETVSSSIIYNLSSWYHNICADLI